MGKLGSYLTFPSQDKLPLVETNHTLEDEMFYETNKNLSEISATLVEDLDKKGNKEISKKSEHVSEVIDNLISNFDDLKLSKDIGEVEEDLSCEITIIKDDKKWEIESKDMKDDLYERKILSRKVRAPRPKHDKYDKCSAYNDDIVKTKNCSEENMEPAAKKAKKIEYGLFNTNNFLADKRDINETDLENELYEMKRDSQIKNSIKTKKKCYGLFEVNDGDMKNNVLKVKKYFDGDEAEPPEKKTRFIKPSVKYGLMKKKYLEVDRNNTMNKVTKRTPRNRLVRTVSVDGICWTRENDVL